MAQRAERVNTKVPTIPCNQAVKCECADANPFANLSAEAIDQDRFFATLFFQGDPPLGGTWEQLGCLNVCSSTISQEDADLCALRQAQQCAWTGIAGGPGWRTPATVGHPNGTQRTVFSNAVQQCTVNCPDGVPFTKIIPAGTILAFSQVEADEKAHNLACKLALQDRICLQLGASGCCLNTFFETSIVATGDTLEDVNNWTIIAGAVPPGLHFFGGDVEGLTVFISGTPTVTGTFSFTVQVVAPNGDTQTHTFTITVATITTATPLPDGAVGTAYSQTLTTTGMTAPVTWIVIAGALPTGLTLNAATGKISGTPTTLGLVAFTLAATDSTP